MAVTTVNADYSETISSAGNKEGGLDNDFAGRGGDGNERRIVCRFPTTSLFKQGTVTKIEFIHIDFSNDNNAPGIASESWNIRPYNTDGSTEPSSDSGATEFTRAGSGSTYLLTTTYRTTGTKTIDITGATAIANLYAQILAGGKWSISVTQTPDVSGAGGGVGINCRDAFNGNPPQLRVTQTLVDQSPLFVASRASALSLIRF